VRAHDCGILERLGLLWLAAGCVLLACFQYRCSRGFNAVSSLLVGTGLGQHAKQWWLLAPLTQGRASYGPAVFLLGVLAVVLLTVLVVPASSIIAACA